MTTEDAMAIEKLLYLYCEYTDAGDFENRVRLFDHAVVQFAEPVGEVRGRDDLMNVFQTSVKLYGHSSPHTAHLCLNPIIDLEEGGGRATARSRFTVFQATDDFPLQVIAVGRYHDEFEKVNGRWRFSRREFLLDLVGDLSANQSAASNVWARLSEEDRPPAERG
jgi:3-phenylpropionate/cinnamic acid dioxygenase small subunit